MTTPDWKGGIFKTADEVDQAVNKYGMLTHARIPAPEYHKTKALSHSTLKKISDSPSKFIWDLENPKERSAVFALGEAIHAAILEPELFAKNYVKMPKFDRRTKDGKAGAEQWEAENQGKIGLSPNDWAVVTRVFERANSDQFFSQFFKQGEKETSFFVTDEATGIVKRCRPDNLVEVPGIGLVVVDLKSTDCALEHVFNQDIIKYGYLTAAAYYMDILEQALGERPAAFAILAVEKTKDCDIAAFTFEEDDLAVGKKIYSQWMDTYVRCREANEWPGYERKFRPFKTPQWLLNSVENMNPF